ncbi:hypothetical protein VE03_06289 [Pseudogymnoascus sp. 23342-1-I1]|nr:hypothetical protein VE03_06289 [Pseudogymnoascus sp. 23342-1-I1]
MSAERKEWGTKELELLQYVKAHNATAKNEYLTKLFNEKNGRKRTPHAIRFRLKRLRKLARESAVAKRFGSERSGTEPRDSTNTRDGADPRNKITIIIPRHPLIISRQLLDATSLCGCDKLSTRLQSNQPSPRDDDLDWYLELPNKLRKIVIE